MSDPDQQTSIARGEATWDQMPEPVSEHAESQLSSPAPSASGSPNSTSAVAAAIGPRGSIPRRKHRRKTAATEDRPREARRYIDEQELSRITTLSRSHLQTMRCRGDGPPYAKLGHRVVYRLADVERWIEERMRRTGNVS